VEKALAGKLAGAFFVAGMIADVRRSVAVAL